MEPTSVAAVPGPDPGSVALSWINPADAQFRGARVLRSEREFPRVPADIPGAVINDDAITPAGAAASFIDRGLKGERVYYYAIAAYDTGGHSFPVFAQAVPISAWNTAARLYKDLPEIYRLLDNAGQLRRFVELLSHPLDELHSAASGQRRFTDLESVDGELLPLLAQWIGLPIDVTLDLRRRRNEIAYAPQYYRTTGVPANLRANVNKFTNWDARIKEFVHNVFMSNHAEQLRVLEMRREGVVWRRATPINNDVACEGRPAVLRAADGRMWLFYHARRAGARHPGSRAVDPSSDTQHVFCRIEEPGSLLPAMRLTHDGAIHKHPAAVQRPDGTIWVFWAQYEQADGRLVPHLRLQTLAAGVPIRTARVSSPNAEPFALADGQQFTIVIQRPSGSTTRTLTVRAHHFGNLAAVTARTLAGWLNREIPFVLVTPTSDGRVLFETDGGGAGAGIQVPASPIAAAMGFAGVVSQNGADAVAARFTGTNAGPFVLANGDTLTLRFDTDVPRTVTFSASDFANIAAATAAEVATVVNRTIAGVATGAAGRVQLQSVTPGATSLVSVLVDQSTAARALGFGVAVPSAGANVDDDEPSAFVAPGGDVHLYWSSRRRGTWNVWHNRLSGGAWDTPRALSIEATGTPPRPDRTPFAILDAANRVWVLWARKLATGLWNIVCRTTTNLNFPALTEADWQEQMFTGAPPGADNLEPSAVAAGASGVDVFYASNRADGWDVWQRTLTPGLPIGQTGDTQITSGQNTQRAPAALRDGTAMRLWLRSNMEQVYDSAIYIGAQTLDGRYSGSTACDTRNATKLGVRRMFVDAQRYTYDTGKQDTNLFARDTVGVYLTPDTDDQRLILRHGRLIRDAIQRVLPIQVRAVFLIEQSTIERIYTYAFPEIDPPVVIGERAIDTILPEVLRGLSDAHVDTMQVRFMRTWRAGDPPTLLPDLAVVPPDLRSRLFSGAFEEEP